MHRLYHECLNCPRKVCDNCHILDEYVKEVYEVFTNDRFNGAEQEQNSGGSTPSQYGLPHGAIDLQDLIEHREMGFSLGNIFKACYRYGKKNDNLYELNKMKWFIDRLIAEEERCND